MKFIVVIILFGNCLILTYANQLNVQYGPDEDNDIWQIDASNSSFSRKTLQVDEGDRVTFPCDVDAGEQDLVWTKDEKTVWVMQFYHAGYYIQRIQNDTRIFPEHTSLIIADSILQDAGEYSCKIYGLNKIITYELVVIAPPRIELIPSSLLIIKEGRQVNVTCLVTGYPHPKTRWLKEGNPFSVGINKNTLVFWEARLSHSGLYACEAENEFGNAKENIILEVQYSPKVSVIDQVIFTGVGQSAYLSCNVRALPSARVAWYLNGIPTDDDRSIRRIVEVGVHRIQIPKVLRKDFGNYTCSATNIWGSAWKTVILTGHPSTPITSLNCYANETDECFISTETLSYSEIISYVLSFKNMSYDGGWSNITFPGRKSNSIYHTKSYNVAFMASEFETALKIKAKNEFGDSGFSKIMLVNSNLGKSDDSNGLDTNEYSMNTTTEDEYIYDENLENAANDRRNICKNVIIVIISIFLLF